MGICLHLGGLTHTALQEVYAVGTFNYSNELLIRLATYSSFPNCKTRSLPNQILMRPLLLISTVCALCFRFVRGCTRLATGSQPQERIASCLLQQLRPLQSARVNRDELAPRWAPPSFAPAPRWAPGKKQRAGGNYAKRRGDDDDDN